MRRVRVCPSSAAALCCCVAVALPVYGQDPRVTRDPFIPLVSATVASAKGDAPPPAGHRPAITNVAVASLTLKGTLLGATRRLALVADSAGHTWVVAEGDRLKDGTVRRVEEGRMEVGGVGLVVLKMERVK